MSSRKRIPMIAVFACVVLILPLASSLADHSSCLITEPETSVSISTERIEDKLNEEKKAENEENAETAAESDSVITLQEGDTFLLDNAGEKIGVLRVDAMNQFPVYFPNGSDIGQPASVVCEVTYELSEEWLRHTTAGESVPAYLLAVSVRYGENSANTLRGWVDLSRVMNFTEILRNTTSNQLIEEMKALHGELENARQTPMASPLPFATTQNGGNPMSIMEMAKNPVTVLIVLGVMFAFLVLILILLQSHHGKIDKKLIRHEEKHKTDIKECLDESPLPAIEKTVYAISAEIQEHTGEHRNIEESVNEVEKKLGELTKPAKTDWQQLVEIAQAEMNQTYYEDWKQAFLVKNWIPQALRKPEIDVPGEFEIAEFGMSHDFAGFASHNPENKEQLFVIPTIADRDLRSRQLTELYHITTGELDETEIYRIIKPAILFSTNNRLYKLKSKGEIRVRTRD